MATDDEITAAEQRLAGVDPVYDALIKTLHACSQDETVRVDSAITALGSVMGSLASVSGILWTSPDLIEALRGLADELEARRESDLPPPPLATLREVFAAARPAVRQ